MVKGKHDFFTNQFLTFVLAVELQSVKLKMYCAMCRDVAIFIHIHEPTHYPPNLDSLKPTHSNIWVKWIKTH